MLIKHDYGHLIKRRGGLGDLIKRRGGLGI